MGLKKYFSKENWDKISDKPSKISSSIFFSWLIIGIIVTFWSWFIKHWYFSVLLILFIAMVTCFIIDEYKNKSKLSSQHTKSNARIDTPKTPDSATIPKDPDSATPKNPAVAVDPSFLTYKFKKYKQIIYILEEYMPKMRSRQTNVVAFFCFLLICLTVASIFSTEIDNKYVFFGGAFLALTYKVIDMMNADTKTAFDKKTAALDKLIDINFELEKNGQPCEERKSTIDSLVKKIVK